MLQSFIDHLVVTAPTLTLGMEYVHDILGIYPRMGGEHPRMGTHNCLLRLGKTLYLEVIAINPISKAPDRPRWFNLDEITATTPPHLATWIVRTNDIHSAIQAAKVSFGEIETMSRGELHWKITLLKDGGLLFDGVMPLLIEWTTKSHPACTLPEDGCSLNKLECIHPRASRIGEILQLIAFKDELFLSLTQRNESRYLAAEILTPSGIRTIS